MLNLWIISRSQKELIVTFLPYHREGGVSFCSVCAIATSFPEAFPLLTQLIWQTVWVSALVTCGVCGMFNMWIISSFAFFIAHTFYVEEILPLYNLFVAVIETKVREVQAKERIRNERAARKILERLLCADVAGEVARFADFRDKEHPLRGRAAACAGKGDA